MKWRDVKKHPIPEDGSPFLFCTDDAGPAVFTGVWRRASVGPVTDQPGLLYLSYTDTSGKTFFRSGGFIRCGLKPTHWMPLPKRPE